MWSLVGLFLCASPVTPEGAAIRFDDALARVDEVSDVAGAAEAAKLRRDGVSRLGSFTSNPQFTVQPGFRADGTTTQPEAQLTLQQSVNLGGLAGARRAVAQEEAAVATTSHRAQRIERRVAVASAWLETWAAQEASRTAHEEEQAAKDLLARLERAQGTGGVTRVELATARAFAAEAAAPPFREWPGAVVWQGWNLVPRERGPGGRRFWLGATLEPTLAGRAELQ